MCRVTNPVDRIIARIASRQRGLVTRRQLRAAGIGPGAIARRIRLGLLHRVHRGVYLVGHTVMPPLARELAAVLACGDGALLSHWTAAERWRLLRARPGPVDVTVAGRNPGLMTGIRVHRSRTLQRRDVARLDGIPLTTPGRTVLDLAGSARTRDLEIAWHEAHNRHLVRRGEMARLVERSPGRRGLDRLLALLDDSGGSKLSRSDAEELLLALIRRARLPEPDLNILLLGEYLVDFVWREHSLVVEMDGGDWHASRQARERDHRRDSDLRSAGWKVERFTDRELAAEPQAVVARLTRALYA